MPQVYNLVSPPAGVLGDDCAALYAGSEWKCLFGQYRMPLGALPPCFRVSDTYYAPPPDRLQCVCSAEARLPSVEKGMRPVRASRSGACAEGAEAG